MLPRILFVDHTAQLGGAELSLLSVAEAFKASCSVVLFEDGPFLERLQNEGIDARVLQAPPTLDGIRREGSLLAGLRSVPGLLKLVWGLSRIARDYDVLLANSQKSMLVASLAGWIARRPVVWYLRDLMSPHHFAPCSAGSQPQSRTASSPTSSPTRTPPETPSRPLEAPLIE